MGLEFAELQEVIASDGESGSKETGEMGFQNRWITTDRLRDDVMSKLHRHSASRLESDLRIWRLYLKYCLWLFFYNL